MRILILGASGYAGSKIREVLLTEYEKVYGTYCTSNEKYENDSFMFQYEVGDTESLRNIMEEVNPDIVISTIRGDFTLILEEHKIIADILAQKQNKKMIFISTSNVFDGALDKPHTETDMPKAESEYGKFKIDCEKILSNKLGENCIIIRIPEIWGRNCPRILKFISDINNKVSIQTYKNIYVNYTTNRQIADWSLYIIKNNLKGTFHIGSKEICEYVDFQNRLSKKLKIGAPRYSIKEFESEFYQAVLPNRKEIPECLQLTIEEVILETIANNDY